MTYYCCVQCRRLNLLPFLLDRQIGLRRTIAGSVTRRFGNRVVRERISSGVIAVTGSLIYSDGLLPHLEEMEETMATLSPQMEENQIQPSQNGKEATPAKQAI